MDDTSKRQMICGSKWMEKAVDWNKIIAIVIVLDNWRLRKWYFCNHYWARFVKKRRQLEYLRRIPTKRMPVYPAIQGLPTLSTVAFGFEDVTLLYKNVNVGQQFFHNYILKTLHFGIPQKLYSNITQWARRGVRARQMTGNKKNVSILLYRCLLM